MRLALAVVLLATWLAAPAGVPAQEPEPSLETIEEAIAAVSTERRRAGTDTRRQLLTARLADLEILRARKLVEAGRNDDAVDAYETALSLAVGHRVASVELAWLSILADEDERARRVVETALIAAPDDPHLVELAGELAYRAHRLRRAEGHYARAVELRPGEPRLAARLDKIRREIASEADFTRADSGHFTVRFDGDRDDALGRMLLDPLENAWNDLVTELDVLPRQPITVILYTREEFRETTRMGGEVAGLYDGKIRLPVGGLDRVTPGLERVVRHELVHALLHVKGRGQAPRWLHEGLAQRYEPRNPDPAHRAVLAESGGSSPSLDPFSYPRSLSFVAFLEDRTSPGRLLWLVDLLAEGRPENQAFLEAYGEGRQELIDAWGQWLTRHR